MIEEYILIIITCLLTFLHNIVFKLCAPFPLHVKHNTGLKLK
jgi:hypothetical protein